MKQDKEKTNVMRILDQKGILYHPHTYDPGDSTPDGQTAAQILGLEPGQVFKTLVARGASGGIYVFPIPVDCTLDLKKAARAAGEKSIMMLPAKELLPNTGYIHGGCSPVGMKKLYPTILDETCELYDTITVSAGKVGAHVEVAPADLIALLGASTADITVDT